MRLTSSLFLACLLISIACNTGPASAQDARLEFTRMVAHWAEYADPSYLDFIDEAQPELVQHGFYGGHFWSLAHTPQYKGYPAHFPVQGLDECGRWFEERNVELHKRGVKVVGHFNVEFLVGEPDGDDGPRGFFHFYRNLWNEDDLGPRPVADPLELLERGRDGQPIINNSYSIGGMREYWACLRNPAWRQVLKAWVKRGIERGLDGFIANYFYRHDCHCEHCQRGFRDYLAERFTPQQLADQFDIADLAAHQFDEIVYWHKPEESTPLRREMLRWSQISNKAVFDEVFVKYGRSLKPDLIVAQWNHISNFSQISGDERCMLPADVWGRDESYLWYSTGAAAYYTDLENRFLGDATLQARYIRGTFNDKPFTLGKYESTRIRAAIAELAANGGAPMGFYTRHTDPDARREIARYYQFMKRNNELFRASRSHAEVVLLYPRSAVHAGNVAPVELFRQLGRRLLDEHVLFDVLPDDLATPKQTVSYRHVVQCSNDAVDASAIDSIVQPIVNDSNLSHITAPWMVRASASRPAGQSGLTLHFVNYNREEPPKDKQGRPSGGRGINDEKPIAVDSVTVDLVLPEGFAPAKAWFLTPESTDPLPVEYVVKSGRLHAAVPELLVYGILQIDSVK